MNYQKQQLAHRLSQIYQSADIANQVKIGLLKGLKQTIIATIRKSRQAQGVSASNLNTLVEQFEKKYKNTRQRMMMVQKRMMERHRKQLELIQLQCQDEREKIQGLKRLSEINKDMKQFIKQIDQQKTGIEKLHNGIQDYYKMKTIKLEVQFENKRRYFQRKKTKLPSFNILKENISSTNNNA